MESDYYRQSADRIIDNMRQRSQDIKRVTKQLYSLSASSQASRRKQVQQGPRGGLYYVNAGGKKTYLTPGQCQRCKKGTLPTASSGCPPRSKSATQCQATRKQLKKTLRLSARQLKQKKKKDC